MKIKKVLITDTDNGIINNEFQYILGFGISLGGIIIDEKEIYIFLDARYFGQRKNIDSEKLKQRIGENLEIKYREFKGNIIDEMSKYLEDSEIYLEDNITLKYFQIFQKNIPSPLGGGGEMGFKICTPFFEEKRLIKQEDEKENIKKAIQIIDKVWQEIETQANSGEIIEKTEAEVRALIVQKILEFGGEGESFEAIVAFGANSAIPHHKAGDTVIGNGVLLVDMGALYKGYCSDFTRTIWIGEITSPQPSPGGEGEYSFQEFKNIYNSVKKAYEKAFEFAKPGISGKDIDKAARESIEQDGYGKYFIHSTGHGVGLNIHEQPWISRKSENTIQENMVFTIEPGIYLPGKFGVRLENIVFAKKDGVECESKIEL